MLVFLLALAKADEWGYFSSGEDWTGTCQTGLYQSPIDITVDITEKVLKTSPDYISLTFSFTSLNTYGVFNGYSYKVTGAFGSLSAVQNNKKVYAKAEIDSFHFHSPSENFIKGKQSDLEMHIVMLDSEKSFSFIVFSISFDLGEENKFIRKLLKSTKITRKFHWNLLLPTHK